MVANQVDPFDASRGLVVALAFHVASGGASRTLPSMPTRAKSTRENPLYCGYWLPFQPTMNCVCDADTVGLVSSPRSFVFGNGAASTPIRNPNTSKPTSTFSLHTTSVVPSSDAMSTPM